MIAPRPTGTLIDASVLINFLHLGRLRLLARLPAIEPWVPEDVAAEILLPEQRRDLLAAFEGGFLRRVPLDDPATLETFADLRESFGQGEAACLALAQHHASGLRIACDEKGAFLRQAEARLGPGRVLGTVDLLFLGVRAALISVEEADAAKDLLATRRFRVPLASFRELAEAPRALTTPPRARHRPPIGAMLRRVPDSRPSMPSPPQRPH